MIKKTFFYFLLFFITIFSIILLIEILLRFSDKDPWGYFRVDLNDPTTNSYHDILGWEPKPGVYKFKAYSNLVKDDFTMTIIEDGIRYSGKYEKNYNKTIATFGGSFTQGVAVDDEDNFPYFLQEKLRKKFIRVENYGVGGYGTYQSLLKLEQIFSKRKFDLVIYSFLSHHEYRNIGDEWWLKWLTKFTKRGHLYLPYVLQNRKGDLVRKKPISYIKLPFREKLVIINKIEKRIMKLKFYSPYKDPKIITQKLILEMKDLSKKNNSKFLLVNLSNDNNIVQNYKSFLNKEKINYLNCAIDLDSTMIVKNEQHPNRKAHKIFSNCILNFIKKNNLLN